MSALPGTLQLDLLGRKVVMGGGAGLRVLGETIAATTARAAGTSWADLADVLEAQLRRLVEVTGLLWAAEDVTVTLANSSVYLEAAGHLVVGWLWLEQALVAEGRDGDFYAGKRQAARYFQRWELPKVDAQLTLLASLDTTTLQMQDSWF